MPDITNSDTIDDVTAFFILSVLPAPKFWLTKVEHAVETVIIGCINSSTILRAARWPAITVLPNPLIALCKISEPIAKIQFIIAIVIPAENISL